VQSVFLDIVIDYFWGFTGGTVGHILQSLSHVYPKNNKNKVTNAVCQPCMLTNHRVKKALKIKEVLSVLIRP